MTLNFPANPSIGARYTLGDKTWEWNGTGWIGAATGLAITLRMSATAPATNIQGDFWLDTTTGVLYTYIDQNNGQWVEFNGSAYPVDYASNTHVHGNITNAGAIGAAANLPVITGTDGVLTVGSFGTAANTFCQGNDSRLSDQRTPTDSSVTNEKVAANAAIAGTKINPDFGSQNITTTGSVNDSYGNIRKLPQNPQSSAYVLALTDIGRYISITTGGVTVPSGIFSAGDAITIYNNSASAQAITQGASVTLRLAGTSATGNRTLDQRGLSTVLCVAPNEFIISGPGLS